MHRSPSLEERGGCAGDRRNGWIRSRGLPGPRVPRSGAPLIESVEKIVTPDGHTYAVRCEVELEGEDVSDLGPRLPQHLGPNPQTFAPSVASSPDA